MAWACGLNLLLVLLLPMAGTSPPDAVVRLNNAFLNHMSNIGIAPLQRALQFNVPDLLEQDGKELRLKKVQILSVDVTNLRLKFIAHLGVHLSALANFSVKILQEPESLDLRMPVGITADVHVAQSSIGSPVVSISACTPFFNGAMLLQTRYSTQPRLLELVKKHLRAVLRNKICLSISNLVQGLNVYLGTSIGLSPVGPESQILYSMVRAPTITENHISLDAKTVLLLLGRPIVPPMTDAPFTLPEHIGTKGAMITVGLSQHLLDSALLLLQKAGVLNMEITADMKSNDNLLNTSSLGQLIPEVARQFPQSMPVVIKVRLGATPVAKLHTNNATLQLQPLVEVLAMTPKSTFQSLFSLNVVVNLNLRFSVSKVRIQGTTSVLGDVQLTLAFSNVGAIDMDQMQAFVGTVFEAPLLNHLNALLGMGISLPKVVNLHYVDPKVIVHEGFIEISSGLGHQS
ncbi:BPI fold-containing family B member 2 [Talpa occidentalis]|uniref:BPI fold-containing family B member 2 n=1 Tax=Talpa occidentalis TaxID=50954 RepID=UPI00188F4CC2|nr:BPI fold-containing family B member 2 [Talpa occidentalis]